MSDTLVLDVGSTGIRYGAAGDDLPKFLPANEKLLDSQSNINNFDALEEVITNSYNSLNWKPSEHGIVVSRHLFSNKQHSKAIYQTLFEKFSVPVAYQEIKPVLCVYSAGRVTALSAFLGHTGFSVAPVYEGCLISSALKRSSLGGSTISNRLAEILTASHVNFNNEDLHNIKSTLSYISPNYEVETQLQSTEGKSYTFYDGNTQYLKNELFRPAEILFKPNLLGLDIDGIHYMINDSIMTCPMDTRNELTKNVVLSGGTSAYKGLQERLTTELKDVDEELFETLKIVVNPAQSAWLGASILGSLSTFPDIALSKQKNVVIL